MQCSGDELVLLAATAAIQLARGRTAEEIGCLAAFFTTLGDNLALWQSRPIPDNPGTE